MNKVYFIADIAANHDGQLDRAKDLCLEAKLAGADAVKFQHFKAETIVSDKGFKDLNETSHQSKWNKSVYDVFDDAAVPLDLTDELVKYCKKIEVDFFTTPYDINYVDKLDQSVSMYKIGSGDITYFDMLKKVASKGKPVLLSTGASTLNEVMRAVGLISTYNVPIVLMQCNTNYTADEENFKYINLNVLKTYANWFPDVILGLSDHTLGHETVLGAIALGAKYIEKHFTDDNNRIGPDHQFSMNPVSWKMMVDSSRRLELALGSPIKKVEDNESETVVLQRRSIRFNNDIKSGHIITKEDISYLRPCPTDAAPIHLPIIGCTYSGPDKLKGDYLQTTDIL